MTRYWLPTAGFAVIAWGFLVIGSKINGGKFSTAINWTCGTAAILASLIAGRYATRTFIRGVIGGIAGWGVFFQVALMVVVLGSLIWMALVLMWDKWSAVAASIPIALILLTVPSALDAGVVPGAAGVALDRAVTTVTDNVMELRTGNTTVGAWFG